MIGAGEEGVGLGACVEAQRAQHDDPQCLGGNGAGSPLAAPYQRVDDQGRSHNGAAGETAAGGQMAVEQNVYAKHQDNGDHQLAHGADDGILIVVHRILIQLADPALTGDIHQHGHGAHGSEQHEGLAQCIESTVVQDHACHGIHRTGLLGAFFHIAFRHFVDRRSAVTAVGGQIGHRQQHKGGKNQAQHDGQNGVGLLPAAYRTAGAGHVMMGMIGDGLRCCCCCCCGCVLLQHGGPVYLTVQPTPE